MRIFFDKFFLNYLEELIRVAFMEGIGKIKVTNEYPFMDISFIMSWILIQTDKFEGLGNLMSKMCPKRFSELSSKCGFVYFQDISYYGFINRLKPFYPIFTLPDTIKFFDIRIFEEPACESLFFFRKLIKKEKMILRNLIFHFFHNLFCSRSSLFASSGSTTTDEKKSLRRK